MHCNYKWIRIQLKVILHPNGGFYEFWFLAHVHAVTTDCPCSSNGSFPSQHAWIHGLQPAIVLWMFGTKLGGIKHRKSRPNASGLCYSQNEIVENDLVMNGYFGGECHITLLATPGFWIFQGSATKKCERSLCQHPRSPLFAALLLAHFGPNQSTRSNGVTHKGPPQVSKRPEKKRLK